MSEPSQDTDTIGELPSSASGPLRDAPRTHKSVVPPEITDYIIDFLHSDKSTLRQCSLVCRDWVPPSSRHLFETLWWPPCYHAWYRYIWSRERCQCATLDGLNFWPEFVRFIEGSQRVRDHVRTVAIVFHWELFDLLELEERGEGTIEHQAKVALPDFANGLDKLPQLRFLYLKTPNFLPEAAPASSTTGSTRALHKLILDLIPDLTLNQPVSPMASNEALGLLMALLRLFGHISIPRIKDYGGWWQTNYNPPFLDVSKCPEVGTLQMEDMDATFLSQYLKILTAAANPGSITTLVIRSLEGEVNERMRPLLRSSLPSLRTLVLRGSSALQVLDRSIAELYPSLRELTVSVQIFIDLTVSPAVQGMDLRSVAECPIPSVEELLVRLILSITDRRTGTPADDLRRSLEALDCTSFNSILHAYRGRTVRLEIRVAWKWLPFSIAQLPDMIRLVEDVVRGRLSARARDNIHLHVCW